MRDSLKRCLLFFCLGLAVRAPASAQTIEFDPTAGFPIRIGGREVLRQQSEPFPAPADRRRVPAGQAVTFIDATSRREFAPRGDRFEFTFEYRLPAADAGLSYEMEIPVERGGVVQVTHGFYLEGRTTEWTIDATPARLEAVRFLRIESAAARFAIDTDPAGAWQNTSDYDKPLRTCIVEKSAQGLRLRFLRRGNRHGGGRLMGKLVLYPEAREFAQIHPFNRAGYKLPLARQHALAFTTRPALKGFAVAGAQPYEAGWGWTKKPPSLQIESRKGNPSVHAGLATGTEPAAFRIEALPGWHFVTLAIGDRDEPTGPMQVAINGQRCVEALSLDAGRFVSPHFAVAALDGRIDIEVSGRRWVLNGVFVQPIMTRQEDFQLARGWWNQPLDWPE